MKTENIQSLSFFETPLLYHDDHQNLAISDFSVTLYSLSLHHVTNPHKQHGNKLC